MMIKKTRIVQIIQEEVRKQQEAHAHDDGITPMPLSPTPKPTAPTDELAYIEIQIIAAKDKLAELEAKHAELSGKEATTSQPPEELEREDTEWADTDYFKRMMGTRYRGRD
tara:strand:+ start:3235 stop:3567 length:333 start_codon:yes stop_codon:yes gene_type:complete